ncbi:TIGR01777 family oxidoreductase [Glycomyces sp. TRM65418]|uniref:TIGR01777 family oxidoreductase n=1 Tax=Glycomyces sp. TRM65418 TaxID=2867006 RepID=UPI001CE5F845|nr:TIGR01777 family oxidoreductase [Glycomyces sp. TRM65418]MCC3762090.1 TIGR01777 family oxidoreductase [Glycomyces sp. TRM65418]QZD56157.1 TIGR01777 family oxidoreductase [Glycomyces sp. TRM65418]
MRIVIAGSSGYLGKSLMEALEGHDLVRLVRHRPDEENEMLWDPYDGPLDPQMLDGVDVVVNLCGVGVGERRWNDAFKKRLKATRVIPTEVLATAVAEAKVPVLVNASAAGWYGDRAEVEVDESTPAATDFLGKLCLAWESATAPAEAAGARVVRLRTGHVLGPESVLLSRFVPAWKCFLGGRFGSGRQYMPWISLRDWVGAAVAVIENDTISGPVNMVGPTPARNRDFARALAAAVHRPAPWPIPGWAVKLVAGEVAVELLRGAKIKPGVLQANGFQYQDETVFEALRYALPER